MEGFKEKLSLKMDAAAGDSDCLNTYVLTFNCARNVISQERFAAHLFDVLPQSSAAPEILALSLQEIAPIYYAFLGGSFLVPYLSAFHRAVDIAAENRWSRTATDEGRGSVKYVNIVTHHCGFTALLVFVRADVVQNVEWTDIAEVGVGFQEMGNKGAVGARLGYRTLSSDDTINLTFVAAHTAPMEGAVERRNQDWKSIVERLVFTKSYEARSGMNDNDDDESEAHQTDGDTTRLLPQTRKDHSTGNQSGIFSPRSHLFFAGDLNYRTSDSPPVPNEHTLFPQPNVERSDAAHHSELFKKDQLTRERRAKRTLHGLTEAPISFPPTYKYSHEAQEAALSMGNGEEYHEPNVWKWAKHRWPSWCDRILYLDLPPWMKTSSKDGRSPTIRVYGYDALPVFPTSDHRPVALAVAVPKRPIPPPPPHASDVDDARLHPPFSIDPTWKSRRETARMKEIVVGGLAYLAMTWEGNGLLLATIAGIFGGWFVLRSLLQGEM